MSTTYQRVNILLCCAFILCLCAVLIVYACGANSCWSRMCYGKDCMLCGCTRDIVDMLSGKVPTRNALSCYLMVGIISEMFWRIVSSCVVFGSCVLWFDICFHSIALLILLTLNITAFI